MILDYEKTANDVDGNPHTFNVGDAFCLIINGHRDDTDFVVKSIHRGIPPGKTAFNDDTYADKISMVCENDEWMSIVFSETFAFKIINT